MPINTFEALKEIRDKYVARGLCPNCVGSIGAVMRALIRGADRESLNLALNLVVAEGSKCEELVPAALGEILEVIEASVNEITRNMN